MSQDILVGDFFAKYSQFVNEVTSKPSTDFDAFIARLEELNEDGCDVERLLTAGVGLPAESGEFTEIVKKIVFQGKPYNDDNVFHMKRELGDLQWYFINACIALGINPVEVFVENIKKLESRYPGGQFDVFQSENRQEGDL